ncbi:hypothetical protein ACD661_13890 [Legionella lytica]|uniref:Uncharacterized protein n=1 Tax=Legionella lytica TaxID=96232 RepID=A0ABW8DCU3_9GAMM
MTIFEILKKIFCCGSSTLPTEQEPILSADAGNGGAYQDIYIYGGNDGVNTIGVNADPPTTPIKKGRETASAPPSPGFFVGDAAKPTSHHQTPPSPGFFYVDSTTPKKMTSGTHSTPSTPGFYVESQTPNPSPAKSTHSSPEFSLRTGDDDEEDTTTQQWVP